MAQLRFKAEIELGEFQFIPSFTNKLTVQLQLDIAGPSLGKKDHLGERDVPQLVGIGGGCLKYGR